jgi:hypothetical protein
MVNHSICTVVLKSWQDSLLEDTTCWLIDTRLDCKFWVVSYALSAVNETLKYTIVSLRDGVIIGFYCRLLLPYFESVSIAIPPINVVCIIWRTYINGGFYRSSPYLHENSIQMFVIFEAECMLSLCLTFYVIIQSYILDIHV